MNPTSVQWRDLTLATGDAPYRLLSLDGWEELPPSRYDKQPRTGSHGVHPSAVFADERIVTATGFCWSQTRRDELLIDLQADAVYSDDDSETTEPVAVTAAGRTLTAYGQLITARQLLLKGEWGIGRFGWIAQWRCPDPLRYGPTVTKSTPLPDAGGGLIYPLYSTSGKLDYGTPGGTGRILLTNPGTAPAAIVFGVRGTLPEGWEVSGAGQRLRSPVAVPAGQVVEIDTAEGTVLVEGTATRRGDLSVADWMTVPRRGELEVQFTSLGGVRDPGALLTATWQETYW